MRERPINIAAIDFWVTFLATVAFLVYIAWRYA
jgi:hypothetical protein